MRSYWLLIPVISPVSLRIIMAQSPPSLAANRLHTILKCKIISKRLLIT